MSVKLEELMDSVTTKKEDKRKEKRKPHPQNNTTWDKKLDTTE